MGRPVGSHFGPSGKPKKRYATKAEAREANREMNQSKQAYYCDFPGCEGWHLGNGTAKRKRKPRRSPNR